MLGIAYNSKTLETKWKMPVQIVIKKRCAWEDVPLCRKLFFATERKENCIKEKTMKIRTEFVTNSSSSSFSVMQMLRK